MSGRTPAVPTVVHIDDNSQLTEHFAMILGQWREVRHIGSAPTGEDGIALCREKRPGIVLLNLWLPDGDGFRFAERIAALDGAPRVLLLSCREDDYTLQQAWSGSFAGLIWKNYLCIRHLRAAFRAVAGGRRYFAPDVLAAMQRLRGSPDAWYKLLTDREQDLIEAFVHGDSNATIAAEFGIAPETVRSHRKHAMAKAGVHRTEDLMLWGMEKGFGNRLPPRPPEFV